MKKLVLGAAIATLAFAAAAPAAEGAVVRAEASWDETIENLVDIHVSDTAGRESYIAYNEIPLSVRTDTPGFSSFTDNEAPNTRRLCFWLDNYGDTDVSVEVTLRAPNGTTIGSPQTIATEASSGLDYLGSSPAGFSEDDCLIDEPPVDPGSGATVPTGSLGLTPLAVTGARAAALKKCKKIEDKAKKKKCIRAAKFKPLSLRSRSGH